MKIIQSDDRKLVIKWGKLGLSDGNIVKLGRASHNYAQNHSAADLIAKFLGIEFREE